MVSVELWGQTSDWNGLGSKNEVRKNEHNRKGESDAYGRWVVNYNKGGQL